MTINLADNTPRVSYAVAAGVTQSSFTVSFEFFDDADLNVYVDGTLKTLTTDYTVTGGDGATGSITMSVTGASGGSTVVITRDIDLKRTTDFPASGAFQVGSLNTELDKLIAIAADLDDKASRALQLTDFDSAVSLVLPDVDTRKGKTLAFNASTGAVESGPSISDVQSVSAAAADIATLADIEDGTDATDAIQTVAGISTAVSNVSGISTAVSNVNNIRTAVSAVDTNSTNVDKVAAIDANVTKVANIDSDVTTVAGIQTDVTNVAADATDIGAVAGKATEIGRLGTADAVADLAILGTSDAVSDMNTLAAISSDITSVADKASFITADFVSDLNTLAVTDVVNDINTLATSDIVSDLNTLATSDIVSDLNTLATTDIVNDINTLATSDIVADLALLATSDFVSDLNTMATSQNVSDLNSVAGSISNVNTVASNISGVNSFGERYRVSANAPTDSLDAGDLWFDSTNNLMKVYGSGGFVNAGSSVNGTSERKDYVVGTSQGSYDGSTTVFPATYDSGFVDVYLNGIKLQPADFTATNGTSVTLGSAAQTSDTVSIVGYGTFELSNFSIGDANNVDLTGLANDQFLQYNSTSGNFEPANVATDLSGDSSPQLGGNLDLNNNNITGTGDISTTGDITIDSASADATVGPTINLRRQSASPAPNDILGQVKFNGKNDANENTTYARIYTSIQDETDGTEDSRLEFKGLTGGAETTYLQMKSGVNTFFRDVELSTSRNLRFEGSTSDNFETTVTVTDPSADRTITLPNATGTVMLTDGDGSALVTATPAELNILDGVTATTAELNIMDGVTATTAELNLLDGVTATTAELNYTDGVTSNIQTQLNSKGGANTPVVTARKGSNQTLSRATFTKITGFTSSEYDSDSAWNGSRFTVPSGKGGRYLISCHLTFYYGSAGNDGEHAMAIIYINGSSKQYFFRISMGNGGRHMTEVGGTGSLIYNLSAGDYVEFYGYMADDSASGTLKVVGDANVGSQIGIMRID